MDPIEITNNIETFLCERATRNLTPINAILELTPLCNMNCDMCFVSLSSEQLKERGRLRSLDEWLTLAEDLKKAGVLFILLTGGEPLLYPGFRTLYLHLKKLGMIITINTNGTLINEDWANFFAQNRPRRINITLYGKDEATYKTLCHYPEGYAKTLNAICLLKQRNVDVKINGSLTPSNLSDIDEMVQLSNEFKIPWKIDTYMYPATRERNKEFNYQSRLTPKLAAQYRVELLYKKLGKDAFTTLAQNYLHIATNTPTGEYVAAPVSCRAGRSSFIINWQGEMRACVMLSTPSFPVFELGFETSWKQLTQSIKQISLNPKCTACTLRELCNTCAACAFLESGDFDGIPQYMCEYTKETLKYMQSTLNKIKA